MPRLDIQERPRAQPLKRKAVAGAPALFLAACVALAAPAARAQGLSVLPVITHLGPGQMTATLTVTNQDSAPTSFQLRAYAWSQPNGADQLTPTDMLLASPPLGTIAPGGSQVVRMMLRQPPEGKEATYRILLDQIPPPASPGMVRISLRLSMPVFAEPATRAVPHLVWHVERTGEHADLVAVNDGGRHASLHDIALSAPGGVTLHPQPNQSPYILAGATRHWRLAASGAWPAPGATLRLTAQSDASRIDEPVTVATPP
jgi:fimbrial chaperone protein